MEPRGTRLGRLYRDFCNSCNAPIRVNGRQDNGGFDQSREQFCERCEPIRHENSGEAYRSVGQKAKKGQTF